MKAINKNFYYYTSYENKSFGAHSAQIAGGEADDKGCTTCDQPRSAGRHRPHREGVFCHIFLGQVTNMMVGGGEAERQVEL